jgi:hypothetical protein
MTLTEGVSNLGPQPIAVAAAFYGVAP